MDNIFQQLGDSDENYGQDMSQYDTPNVYELMGEYVLQDDMPSAGWTKGKALGMGMTEDMWQTLETFKTLIPEYHETSGPFKEAYDKKVMVSQLYDADAKRSKQLRSAKMQAGKDAASYGKMGFRSGETNQMSQYLNQSVRNASNSASASAQKARLGFKAKVDERRKGFVENLWDLYGDFIASSPDRVER